MNFLAMLAFVTTVLQVVLSGLDVGDKQPRFAFVQAAHSKAMLPCWARTGGFALPSASLG